MDTRHHHQGATTQAQWRFGEMKFGEIKIDPIEGEFFATEALGSPNYDLYSMTGAQIIALLPAEFAPWSIPKAGGSNR